MRPIWMQWVVVQAFFCMNLVCVVGYAIAAGDLAVHLDLSQGQLGLIGGAYFVAYSLSQFALGLLLTCVPLRPLIACTAVVAAIGAWGMVTAESFLSLLWARVLLGIGFGMAFVGVVHVIGRIAPKRFPLMLNISQSAANGAGALVGLLAFVPVVHTPSRLFSLCAVILLILAALMLLLLGDLGNGMDPAPAPSQALGWRTIASGLGECLGSLPFWVGTLYFLGLFSCFLALEDLWNIRFQINVFAHKANLAATINAMTVLGLGLGGVISGVWAERTGLQRPARWFSILALLMMMLLISVRLSEGVAFVVLFLLGFGLGAAPLGLAFVRQQLSERAALVASPLLLTIVFMGAGALMAGVGGELTDDTVLSFRFYQEAMTAFIIPVAIAVGLGCLIRSPSQSATTP